MTLVLTKIDHNPASDLFPLIFMNDLLKYFNDYGTLKTIQQSTTALNDLFTCPSQLIWKQLCSRNRYHYVLRKESRCLLKRFSLIWETIYYQNWKLDRNWINKQYEIVDIGKKMRINKNLTRMINGRASIGLSIHLEDLNVRLWDFKRGTLLFSEQVHGQVTSSCLQANYLALGMKNGSMTIIKLFTNDKWTRTVKYHSKEISAVFIDLREETIVSGDVGGQIIKFKILESNPEIVYQTASGSGITALLLQSDHLLGTTIDGYFIKLGSKSIKRYCFSYLGSINCMAESNDKVLMGTDSGKLIVSNRRQGFRFEETSSESPIISIAADATKIVTGHFDGSITAFSVKLDGSLKKLFTENNVNKGAVWSVGIYEQGLVSCSTNGEVILRRFL